MALLDKFRKKKSPDASRRKVGTPTEASEKSGKTEKKPTKKKKSVSIKTSGKNLLNVYRIIQRPHITEKAAFLAEGNKYVFRVFPKANKTEVKKVIQSLYGVKVEKVHIIHSSPKKRRLGKTQGFRHGLKKGFKKAIVTLKKGDKIELLSG